ncbi:hypothetical protein BT67DRAFT_311497 [Trichocladium antarcticum]|uniref:Uncharacterized protein n=1 Tax=Trichocladium antarcticum TaxID=1450529 RepID=A0AAN6ZDV3_9PEZI|nr:hypothetical protein BT67DRAFT_311497 [Trichocladium antarcticum]
MSESELSKALSGDAPLSSSPSRRPSISLQAAATMNAGLQRESPTRPSPTSPFLRSREPSTSDRRRSQVLMNLQIADPAVPAPGEMVSESPSSSYQTPAPFPFPASPRLMASGRSHHSRTPSLGELHQELENEQEFQVNRLLAEIHRLRQQVESQQQGQAAATGGDEAPDRAAPLPIATSSPHTGYPISSSLPRSPGFPRHPRSSFDIARRSRTPSRHASPRMRSTSITGDAGEQWSLTGRDESAFYQAETQSLTRENQMLRHRCRELAERQLVELQGNNASITHEPAFASQLSRSVSVSEDNTSNPTSSTSQSTERKAD